MAESQDGYSARGSRRQQDPNYSPIFVRGEGAYLWDDQGRRYIDFVSGYSSTLFGHAHRRLADAASEQAATLTQLVGLRHPWRAQLERALADRLDGSVRSDVTRVWLTTSGARAVEVAWKMAFAHRPGAVWAFDSAYHGRSLATSQITDTKRLPIVDAGVDTALRFPRCDRCPVGKQRESCRAECFDNDEQRIAVSADQISAVFVEPALGARGYYFAPPIFFQRLRAVTKQHGIVLIDDEVQMGLGRLGSFLAAERQGWKPDLVVLGKSLGGGVVPIAAVIGPSKIVDALQPGFESETFAANPLACRMAIEALSILDDKQLIKRAREIEARLEASMNRLQAISNAPFKYDVLGASAVIRTSPDIAEAVAKQTVEQGLLVHWSGVDRERIVLIPPLTVSDATIDEAFEILRGVSPIGPLK